jgi:hypothetical protein
MIAFLAYLRDSAAGYIALAAAAALIAAEILAAAGWSLPVPTAAPTEPSAASVEPSPPAETIPGVSNYVLFTSVKADAFTVMTGTRYASTDDRKVIEQWCYIDRDTGVTDQVITTIAEVDEGGKMTRSVLPPSSLAHLGIDAAQAAALVDSHCRFQ